MSEVDDMKIVIAEQRKQRDELIKRVNLAIELVDRTRKKKRAESSHPN